jgi:hypothetical protein
VLDAHATRFVDTTGDVDAVGERTVREFPRKSPCGGEPAVDAYLNGAVRSDVATPEVVFAGAVDVGAPRRATARCHGSSRLRIRLHGLLDSGSSARSTTSLELTRRRTKAACLY